MAKLKVSVNKNPTKEGIKVQFVLPQTLEGDKKAEATQKLQSKLNQGLEQYNLTVSQDTDVPYSNVIGFLIPIADIKLLIKNAIGGGSSEEAPAEEPAPEEEAPAEEPAPEEPMKEIKRMMELAGLKEDEPRTKMGLYLMFNAKDGKLAQTMEFPNHSENEAVKKAVEAKGEYKLYYTDDPSNYLKFKGDGFRKYVGKTAEELGVK